MTHAAPLRTPEQLIAEHLGYAASTIARTADPLTAWPIYVERMRAWARANPGHTPSQYSDQCLATCRELGI